MYSLLDFIQSPRTSGEIVVDLFAGGGGASEGIKMAIGRDPDAAVNHNPKAVAMHAANHPDTEHWTNNVWSVSPTWVTRGRPVGLLHASPDCTHFSKAKGGKPNRDDKVRSLAMVITDKWVPEAKPRVILMENVEEIKTWGPLDSRGVPVKEAEGDHWRMFLRRLRRAGYRVEWRELRACDYGAPTIRKRLFLIARCDGQPIVWPNPTHGDPKSETVLSGKLKPWRTAAECIDWSIPCPSIFDTSKEIFEKYGVRAKRPLAEKTLKRIAEGIRRYVLEAAEPFIVKANHTASYYNCFRGQGMDEPLQTVTKEPGFSVVTPRLLAPSVQKMRGGAVGHDLYSPMHTVTAGGKAKRMSTGNPLALTVPILEAHYGGDGPKAMRLPDVQEPMRTVSTENRFGLVSAFLAKHFSGVVGASLERPAPTVTTVDHNSVVAAHIDRPFGMSRGNDVAAPLGSTTADGGGHSALVASNLTKYYGCSVGFGADEPVHTLTAGSDSGDGRKMGLVTSNLVKMRGANVGQQTDEPLRTISAGGTHHAEVRAFLMKYYSEGGQDQAADDPMHTLTTRARMGLVTIEGQEYVITDIGMRMLQPRELYRAQGFPDTYIIDRDADGNALTKTDQVRMCGNSVCPPVEAALVRANVVLTQEKQEVA